MSDSVSETESLRVVEFATSSIKSSEWHWNVFWSGQGADDDPACEKLGDGPFRTEEGWIHRNWTVGGQTQVDEAKLELSVDGYLVDTVDFPCDGDPSRAFRTGAVIQFFTLYYELEKLEAIIS